MEMTPSMSVSYCRNAEVSVCEWEGIRELHRDWVYICLINYIENDATLDEVIEENRSASVAIEFSQQNANQVVGQSVAESRESIFQFVSIDVAGVVGVERTEAVLPVGHVLPEGAEVLEADRSAVLLVEHSDHEANCLGVESGPSPVRKR